VPASFYIASLPFQDALQSGVSMPWANYSP